MNKELELAAFRSLIEEARQRGDQDFIDRQHDDLVSTFCDLIEGISYDKLTGYENTDLPEELLYLEVIKNKIDYSERVSWFLGLVFYFETSAIEKSIECAEKALVELDEWLKVDGECRSNTDYFHFLFRANFFLVTYERDVQHHRKIIKDNVEQLMDLTNSELSLDKVSRAEILCGVYLYELLEDELCFPALREQTYKTLKSWGGESPEVVQKMIEYLGVNRGEYPNIPKQEYEFWFDTLVGFIDNGAVVIDTRHDLAHSFAKLGKKFASEKYLKQALKLYQKGVYDAPNSWPAYLYCAKTCESLAELSEHSRNIWLEQAFHFYIEGCRQAPSPSIIFPAGRFCNENFESVRTWGLSQVEHEELLLEGEKLGDGRHWTPYHNLFSFYWINKKRNEAFCWALRGWIKLGPALESEFQLIEAQLKTLPSPEIEKGLKAIDHYENSGALQAMGVGLTETSAEDLRHMSCSHLIALIEKSTP